MLGPIIPSKLIAKTASAVAVTIPKFIAESQWEWLGADSGTLNVETPEVNLGVAVTGGQMILRKKGSTEKETVYFGGAGASLGLSAIPSPVNFSFSGQEMAATGTIYRLPASGGSLDIDEIKGPFIMGEVSGDFNVGGSACIMLCGGNRFLATMPNMTAAFALSCKAAMVIAGATGTIVPGGISGSAYVGELL
ncbi:hypothetical protein IV417_01950 [Alphaproteobacteria bacterium KMM 3653]|uniref:Uncharacterized protein n=1 Tax=Harenicola maris TaxID=2841044 RepID=A0AAP2CPJ7_9RHOB|nr:hypothetical protein [Harenicola maris]